MKMLRNFGNCIKYGGIVILISLIANIVYGKIKYMQIPEVDERMFLHTEHQTILPDDEDALIQLNSLNTEYGIWHDLSVLFDVVSNPYTFYDNLIWRGHPEECLVVYYGDEYYGNIASCGTWVWNENTLDRVLNFEFDSDEIRLDIAQNGESISLNKYIKENETQIREDLENLNRIVSMDYYLSNDKVIEFFSDGPRDYTRGSMMVMLYYIQQQDWDNVEKIININLKMNRIFDNLGGRIGFSMSINNTQTVGRTINSVMKLLPEDLRGRISELYSDNIIDREILKLKIVQGEYLYFRRLLEEDNSDSYPLYPLYSKSDIKNLGLYILRLLYEEDIENYNKYSEHGFETMGYSIYNILGEYALKFLSNRDYLFYYLNLDIFRNQALIENLKTGEYNIWFDKMRWDHYTYNYGKYRIKN